MIIGTKLDDLKFEIQDEEAPIGTKFKVIGVGGGGSNAVSRMMSEGLEGVEFYVLNTDRQALDASPAPNKLQIGTKITNGLGAGANPAIGRQAALDDTEHIVGILEGADMVFITAGFGSGTGTGATPVIASLAKELGALTVAVVSMPFTFEGPHRAKQAAKGLAELASTVDTVVPIYNDRLLALVPKGTSFSEAFRIADDVVRQAVQGISDIITRPGLINRDFADIKATMLGMGYAMMGTATASGENAAIEAARQAIRYPLMDESGIAGAESVLVNITGSSSLGLHDVNEACTLIREAVASDDVQLNFGVVLNESMRDAVKVTVIAAGFGRHLPSGPQKPARPEPVFEPFSEPVTQVEVRPELSPLRFEIAEEEDLDVPAYLRQEKLIN